MNERDGQDLVGEIENEPAVESVLENAQDGVVIRALADLPERTLLDEAALARAMNISKRTVRRMVSRYELPPPVRFSGRSMWQVGRVLSWFEERADRVARNADRQARKLNQLG